MIRISGHRGFSDAIALLQQPTLAYGMQQAGVQVPAGTMDVINTARLAAKTGQVMASGTEQEKAAAAEAIFMAGIAMAPGGVYAIAFMQAFQALASLFPATGSVPVWMIASDMWAQRSPNCFNPDCMTDPPLIGVWKRAIGMIELVWASFRSGRKLPPAPVAIKAGFLVPLDPADRLTMPWPNEHLIESNPNAGIGPDTLIQGADQCLLYWLYAYVLGWATRHGCVQYSGSSQATVQNTPLLGKPEEGGVGSEPAGLEPTKWMGKGPFGLLADNWPSNCESHSGKNSGENCRDLFVVCVRECWTYRLDALNKAMPELVGAAVAQSMLESYTAPKVVSVPTLKTGVGVQTPYPCPTDHPYYAKTPQSPLCNPASQVWAYTPTTGGAKKCIGGAAPVSGTYGGKTGMLCTKAAATSIAPARKALPGGAPVAVAPNALVTWAKNMPQVTWYVAGAALLIALVGGAVWYIRRNS